MSRCLTPWLRCATAAALLALLAATAASDSRASRADTGGGPAAAVTAELVTDATVPPGVALWQLASGGETFAYVEVPLRRPAGAEQAAHSLVIGLGRGSVDDAVDWSELVADTGFVVALPATDASTTDGPPVTRLARLVSRLVPGFAVNRVYLVATGTAAPEALSLLISHPLVFSGAMLFPGHANGAVNGAAAALATIRIPLELWTPPHSRWQTLYDGVERLQPRSPVQLRVSHGTAGPAFVRSLPAALLDLGLVTPEQVEPLQPAPTIARSWHRARASTCRERSPGSYSWPLRPFDRAHPVRGGFGDPRTVFGLGTPTDAKAARSAAFHDGIDISAAGGTRVYPVVSGVVARASGDSVVVQTVDRTFVYRHIHPTVARGRRVVAGVTVLGRVSATRRHLHFTEIDGIRVVNPLAHGHLSPVVDRTPPTVKAVLAHDTGGRSLDAEALRGRFELDALAYDTPSLPVAGAWDGMPTAPALVRWRLVGADGTVAAAGTAADFRKTLPLPHAFRRVYAPGTYQNFPVIGLHWFMHTRGRYLFRLTPSPLDAATLGSGDYRLTVTATDVCGNRGSLTVALHVDTAG